MSFNSVSCSKKDTVDVTGLCTPGDITEVISKNPYWMQMYIPETLQIPDAKPDAEEIDSVNISVNILRKKVVKTPISTTDSNGNLIPNLEGKISTGRKLIIEGELCQRVDYTALNEVQSMHSAHFYVPFSAYIVVPKEIEFADKTSVDSLDLDYQVDACIEDLTIKMLDERTILKQVTLLLYATPNQSC